MAGKAFSIGHVEIGTNKPFVIVGPCVVESREIAFKTAEEITRVAQKFNIPAIYKSSYMKANRQSGGSFSTIGITKALKILAEIKTEFNLPVLTDVHTTGEVEEAASVADCLQIPAFLCRQTDLIKAAAKTGKALNIKKGQFMAPENMKEAAQKAEESGKGGVMLTERGTTFGYHDLVVDYRSIIVMQSLGYPVVFDSTHSVQKPGAAGGSSGGAPEFIIPLARAAAAIGVDGIFLETHPDPQNALCDRDCQLKLNLLDNLIERVLEVWQ